MCDGLLGNLIRNVYYRPAVDSGWAFDDFVQTNAVRYYSYGRYALRDALLSINVRKGEKILVPSFICRDLLAAIHTTGAEVVFYPVDKTLGMACSADTLPVARAILAVNYFGFPQCLDVIRSYCGRTGAVLIEDNAHGLLSRDEDGVVLGCRGDFGIFSLRKTVAMPNGAALVCCDSRYPIPAQLPFEDRVRGRARMYVLKRSLCRLVPVMGVYPLRMITLLGRKFRKLRTGHDIAPSPREAEQELPRNASPCTEMMCALSCWDADREVGLRRELYMLLQPIIVELGGDPVFVDLPSKTVPYVFPFRAHQENAHKIRCRLADLGLECHRWPELPDAVIPQAPEYYKSVWMVGFLW